MAVCLNCGYEYLPGIKRCPDCGAELAPAFPEPIKEPLARVWDSPDEITAIAVKAALDDAGIPVVEQVHRAWAYDGIDLGLRGTYSTFLVPESRAEQAGQLIAERLRALESGEIALEDDSEPGADE
jgi:hypothetical protein